jgi:hypothetical protein
MEENILLHQCKTVLKSFVILASFSAYCWASSSRHELNGTWNLVPAKCQFAGEPALQTGTVTIYDREHNVYVSESYTYDDAGRTISYSFDADAPRNASISAPNLKRKAKWDGSVLKLISIKDNATTLERFSLAGDGSLILTVDRPGHSSEILVFERQ